MKVGVSMEEDISPYGDKNHGRKRQTKHIKTKKVEQLERLDKAVWLIPLVIVGRFIWKSFGALVAQFQENIIVGVFTLVLFVILLGVFYIPLMILWRSVSKTLKKNAIAETTFPVLEDLEYFRDELTDISPATISMCVDYAIERDKDLAAQLLKFTMQGYIETEGNQIKVLPINNNVNALSSSEQFLLTQLANGTLTESIANQWAAMAKEEVLAGPYLKAKKKSRQENAKEFNREQRRGCVGCLPSVIVLIAMMAYLGSGYADLLLNLDVNTSNADLLTLMIQEPSYLISVALPVLLVIGLFVSAILPFALMSSYFTSARVKTNYTRTPEGEILTEEIYGLKNFIHDFSDLEHAQKETLVLWDDFLIYAVLLEENTSIVNEITAMRNLHIVTPDYIK